MELDEKKGKKIGRLKEQGKRKGNKKKSENDDFTKKKISKLKELKKRMKKTKKLPKNFEAYEILHKTKKIQNQGNRHKKTEKYSKKPKGSRSQEKAKNPTKKYVKMGKDRYALTKNISRLIRQNAREKSQEKTLKLQWQSMEKKALEEKKRLMEIFNETIRRKNLKQLQDHKKKSKSASLKPWGFDQRKLQKGEKRKRREKLKGELSKHLARFSDKERRKRIGADFLNKMNRQELKKLMRISKKKNTSMVKSPLLTENSRIRERSFEEKRAIQEFRKRQNNRLKNQIRKIKLGRKLDKDKIKSNLMKVDEKAKKLRFIGKNGGRKPKKSKSSSELMSESRLKKILGRSDSIPSLGENEEIFYQEYKNMISSQSKSRQIENLGVLSDNRHVTEKRKFVNVGLRLSLHRKNKSFRNDRIKKYLGKNSNFMKIFSSKNKIRNSVDIDKLFSVQNFKKSKGKRKRDKSRNGRKSRNHRKSQNFKKIHQIFGKGRKNRDRKRKRKRRKSRKLRTNFQNEIANSKEKEMIKHEILLPQISDSDYLLNKRENGKLDTSKIETNSFYTKTEKMRKIEIQKNPENFKTLQPKKSKEMMTPENEKISKEKLQDSESSENHSYLNSLDNDVYSQKQSLQRKELFNKISLSRRESSGPFSKKDMKQCMHIIQELSINEGDKIDNNLKIIMTQFCKKMMDKWSDWVDSSQGKGSLTDEKGISSLSKFKHGDDTSSMEKIEELKHSGKISESSRGNITSRSKLSSRRNKNLGLDIKEINREYDLKDKKSTGKKSGLRSGNKVLRSSFEWLRRELEQNIENFKSLAIGTEDDDKEQSLKEMRLMMERNQSMSNMFDLREKVMDKRYQAQKKLIEEIKGDSVEDKNRRKELGKKLEKWHRAERELLFDEKKKITKGWLTSIEAIRKIKRDMEIADKVKLGSTYKRKIMLGEDLNIFNVINRSHCSPTSSIMSITGKMSPLISPSLKKITMKKNIISDPNMRRFKLPKGNQPKKSEKNSSKRIQIKDNPKQGRKNPPESHKFKPIEAKVDSLHSTVKWKGSPFGSPPAHAHPSENSSNLYNLTPTTFKGRPRGSSTWKKSERKSLMIEKDVIAKRDTSPILNSRVEPRKEEDTISEDPFEELEKLDEELKMEEEELKKKHGEEFDIRDEEDVFNIEDREQFNIDDREQFNIDDREQFNIEDRDQFNIEEEINDDEDDDDGINHSKDENEKSNYSGGDFGVDFSQQENDFIESDEYQKMTGFDLGGKKNDFVEINRKLDLIDDDDGERINEIEMQMTEGLNSAEDEKEKMGKKPFEGKFRPQGKNLDSFKTNTIEIDNAEGDEDDFEIKFEDLDDVLPGSVDELMGGTIDSGNPISEDQIDVMRDTEGNILGDDMINLGTDTLVRKQFGYDDFENLTLPSTERDERNRKNILRKVNGISDEVMDIIFTEVIEDILQLLDGENNQIPHEGPLSPKIMVDVKMPKSIPRRREERTDQIYVEDGRQSSGRIKPKKIHIVEGERHGIRVNFNAVKDYLSILCNFIKSLKGEERQEILIKIKTPYGMTVLEKMAIFREGYDDNEVGSLSSARACQRAILNFEIYLRLEEDLTLMNSSENRFKQELEHIHNKMLFDSFNEALDSLRPYDLKGCPFPWRANAGRLKKIKNFKDDLSQVLDKAQERVLDWAMFMCGFIPDKEDSMLGEIMIEEDYLNQIKEDRLIKMLTCEAFETDERWLIYDDEEVEVQTEVAELVFDQLLEEVISDLGLIKTGKKVPIRKPHIETSVKQLQNIENLKFKDDDGIHDLESDIRQLEGNSSKFRTDKKEKQEMVFSSLYDKFDDDGVVEDSDRLGSLKGNNSFTGENYEYGIDDVNDFDNL